jgi:hypothetical protein
MEDINLIKVKAMELATTACMHGALLPKHLFVLSQICMKTKHPKQRVIVEEIWDDNMLSIIKDLRAYKLVKRHRSLSKICVSLESNIAILEVELMMWDVKELDIYYTIHNTPRPY